MKNSFIYIGVFLLGVFISSCSQILLKKSANKKHENFIREYLNSKVIIAYVMFFSATMFSTLAFKVVPLAFGPVLESTGYIYITLLSYFFLKEKITMRKSIGIIIIIFGVFIFAFVK